jgi:hypothetical protein
MRLRLLLLPVVFLVSFFVVALLAVFVHQRDDALRSGFLATRNLPSGHLIIGEDLVPRPREPDGSRPAAVERDTLIGRYTSKVVAKGSDIRLDAITPTPSVNLDATYVLVPVDRKLLSDGALDVAEKVSLCAGTTSIATGEVAVIAFCPTGTEGHCLAAVIVAPGEFSKLAGQNKENSKLAAVPATGKCG